MSPTTLVAVVFGHLSLNQLKVRNERGRGMAIAGLVLGYVSIGVVALAVASIFGLAVIGAASNN